MPGAESAALAGLQVSINSICSPSVPSLHPTFVLSSARAFSSIPATEPTRTAEGASTTASSSGKVDPFGLVRSELECVTERMRSSVAAEVSSTVLRTAANYYFKKGSEGKRLRPAILLLLASALRDGPPPSDYYSVDLRLPQAHPTERHRRQQRIAEIAEMIHVASLLHDDVIDESSTRRGLASVNSVLGPKIAILAGDFLLARASVTLASLRHPDVIELMARVIENLVAGEIMQMQATEEDLTSFEHYEEKTFKKTASLIANSCQSVAVLAEQDEEVCQLAFRYGQHLGLAFQVVDDILDFTSSSLILGKPALNDLRSGLATAPVLFAAERHPQLRALIRRKFKGAGDVEQALAMVQSGGGIERARELAARHASLAAQAIRQLPPAASPYTVSCREALVQLTEMVLTRSK